MLEYLKYLEYSGIGLVCLIKYTLKASNFLKSKLNFRIAFKNAKYFAILTKQLFR